MLRAGRDTLKDMQTGLTRCIRLLCTRIWAQRTRLGILALLCSSACWHMERMMAVSMPVARAASASSSYPAHCGSGRPQAVKSGLSGGVMDMTGPCLFVSQNVWPLTPSACAAVSFRQVALVPRDCSTLFRMSETGAWRPIWLERYAPGLADLGGSTHKTPQGLPNRLPADWTWLRGSAISRL